MSQSGLADHSREADWDTWYLEHLRVMVSVSGIDSAQRFKTSTPGYSPSLAMYSVRSASVFEDPYYLSVRGLGEFLPLIDKRHYRRNLFAGLDLAPAVRSDETLLVWDAPSPCDEPRIDFIWLEAIGVDKSTPYRGIAVVGADRARALPPATRFARYAPASVVFHKPVPSGP